MGDSTPKDPYGNSIDEEILFYMEGQPFYAKVDPHSKTRKAEAEQKRKAEQEAKRMDALQADKPWLRDNFAYEPHTAEVLAQATAYTELGSVFADFNKASKESVNLYSDVEAVKSRADFKLLMQDRTSDATSMFGTSKPHLNRYVGNKIQKFENVFNNRTDLIAKKRLHSAVNKQFEVSTGQYLEALQDPDTEPDVWEAAKEALEYTCTAQGRYNFEPPEKYQQRINDTLEKMECKRNTTAIRRLCENESAEPKATLATAEPLLLQEMLAQKTGKRSALNKDVAAVMETVSAKLGLNPLEARVVTLSYAMQQKADGKQALTDTKQITVKGTQKTKKAVADVAISTQQTKNLRELPTEQSITTFAQQIQQQMNTALTKAQEKVDIRNATRALSGFSKRSNGVSVMEKLEAMQEVLLQYNIQSPSPSKVYYVASANTGVVSDVPMPLVSGKVSEENQNKQHNAEISVNPASHSEAQVADADISVDDTQNTKEVAKPDALAQALAELKVGEEVKALGRLLEQLNDKAIIAENQEVKTIAQYLMRRALRNGKTIVKRELFDQFFEETNIQLSKGKKEQIEIRFEAMQETYDTDKGDFFAVYIQSSAKSKERDIDWLGERLFGYWQTNEKTHPELAQLREFAEDQANMQIDFDVQTKGIVLFPKKPLYDVQRAYKEAINNNRLGGFIVNMQAIKEVLGKEYWSYFKKELIQGQEGDSLKTLLIGLDLGVPEAHIQRIEKLNFPNFLDNSSAEKSVNIPYSPVSLPTYKNSVGYKEVEQELTKQWNPYWETLQGKYVKEKQEGEKNGEREGIENFMLRYTAALYVAKGSINLPDVAKEVLANTFEKDYLFIELYPNPRTRLRGDNPPYSEETTRVLRKVDAFFSAGIEAEQFTRYSESQSRNPTIPIAIPRLIDGRPVVPHVLTYGFMAKIMAVDFSQTNMNSLEHDLLRKHKLNWKMEVGRDDLYKLYYADEPVKNNDGTEIIFSIQEIEKAGYREGESFWNSLQQ